MTGFPWGGSEELWFSLAGEALMQGHKVTVSVKKWPSVDLKIQDLQRRGSDVTWWEYPRGGRRARYWQKVKPPFRAFFQSQPELIFVSQSSTYDCAYRPDLTEPLYAAAVPYFVICQLNDDTFALEEAARRRAVEFFERAATVMFVSEHNLRLAERQLACTLPHARVVKNPVNLSAMTPVPWPAVNGRVQMANVGRLEVVHKGQEVLLECLSAETWRERNWNLSFCGDGPDKSYLRALTDYYGLSERVQFRGQVADIRGVWAENEILLLPSRREGTPLALVEAMLCGRPSVVTDVGGNIEWVREGQTGFISEAPSVTYLSAALERAWESKADWPQMGARAHQAAMAKYDPSPARTVLKVAFEAARVLRNEVA